MIALTHVPSPNLYACEKTYVPAASIDVAQARVQHTAYCRLLSELGCEVLVLDCSEAHADSTFVEDTAVILDELAVLASMGTESRRKETDAIRPFLSRFRPLETIHLPATLEGGDVLRVGRRLLVGCSRRTNRAGIDALKQMIDRFGYEILPVPVHGCLHLKTACTALPDGRLIVNPNWIELAALSGWEVLAVPDSEPWAANLCLVGESIILPAEHEETAEMLRNLGAKTYPVPLSEFAKAEGGATCLSLLIPSSRANV